MIKVLLSSWQREDIFHLNGRFNLGFPRRKAKSRLACLHLLFLMCLYLKVTLMPKWAILGWCILLPFKGSTLGSTAEFTLYKIPSSSIINTGFPGGASGKQLACQCRRHKRCGFNPWVGKIPWRKAWQPTAVFLPGESHGKRSLAGSGP